MVPTPAMAAHLRELGVTARIEVVPSGIDVARFGAGRRDEALRGAGGRAPSDRLLLLRRATGQEKRTSSCSSARSRMRGTIR